MPLLKRTLRLVLGVVFLVLGLAGLVLPILQGWLFLALALIVLSRDVPFLGRLESRIISRSPRMSRFFERLRKSIPLWDD